MNSLENLCLEKIICKFDIYNSAYSTTKNPTLKVYLEFLQRVYSLEIINKLNERYLLKVEYIDFIINKHLKVLNSDWLEDCTWNVIKNKIAEIGVGLEKVLFQNENPWEEVIYNLPNLKSITYPDFCNDKTLSYLAKYCRNIEIINIQHSKDVSRVGITYLCCNENGEAPCPFLKEINLELSCVDKDGIEYLIKNLPSLEKIDYEELPELLYSVHKNDINEVNKVKPYNITSLNLCNTIYLATFTDILQVCVSVCPHIKSLECNVSTEYHINLISQLSEIKDLNLCCIKETPLCINNFLKLKGSNLLSLKLNNFSFSVFTLARKCRQLSSLFIHNNTFVHNDNEIFPDNEFIPMYSLKNLYFDTHIMNDACINKPYIHCLLSSPNLKTLGIKFGENLTSDIRSVQINFDTKVDVEVGPVTLFNFMKDILMTCSSLDFVFLDGFEDYYSYHEMNELVLFADTLPNRPKLKINSFTDDFTDDIDSDIFNFDDDDYFEYENYDFDYDSDEDDYDDYPIFV